MTAHHFLCTMLAAFGAFLEHHVERDQEQQHTARSTEGINRDVHCAEKP